MSKISKNILGVIHSKTSLSEQAIRNEVSRLKIRKCPKATQNAAAQIFAQSRGFSVSKMLSKEDKATLPAALEIEKPLRIIASNSKPRNKRVIEFVRFPSDDYFLQEHIKEINKAYTAGCYTSAFILLRKVIENLLIKIIRKKYPGKSLPEREIYWDMKRGRFLDLKFILENLSNKSRDFGPESTLVKKIVTEASDFKDDANDKAHSLYHIVKKKKELDDKEPQGILELIKQLFSTLP